MFKFRIYSSKNEQKISMKTHTAEILKTLQGEPGAPGTPGKDGQDGNDYILTEADKKEIAGMIDVDISELPEGVATKSYVENYAQPKGDYITAEQLEEEIGDIDITGVVYCGDEGEDAGTVPLNADTLGGKTENMLSVADSVKLNNQNPGYYKVAYNLLDNSDFRNPVNQRGATSYSGAKQYTIDRWKTGSSELTVNLKNGYISLTNNATSGRLAFEQVLGTGYAGKTLTVAICDHDTGNVYCRSATVPNATSSNQCFGDASWNGHSVRMTMTNEGAFCIDIMTANAKTLNVRWVALYEGEYTAETLPTYMPKGYAHELLECQRYCYVIPKTSGAHCYAGYSNSTTNVRITIDLPVPLRAYPEVTIDNIESCNIYDSIGGKNASSFSINQCNRNALVLNFTTTGLTAWTCCTARFNTSVTISADL